MIIMKNSFPFFIRMFIGLGYVVMGIVALVTPAGELLTKSKSWGMIVGVLLIIYGAFRTYRNVKMWDKTKYEE